MEHSTLFFTLAIIFGGFMAWGIGANDVSNAMGTSVGSKALKYWQAIIVATIFEASGAILAGGHVTDTIRHNIININDFSSDPLTLVYGMLAALLAASLWLIIASYKAWPVSTTHTVIGALIGFALITAGPNSIKWQQMTNIVGAWIISPAISGIIAFILYSIARYFVLSSDQPFRNAKRTIPIYIFYVTLVISLVTLLKGLSHIGLHITFLESIGLGFIFSLLIMLIGIILLNRVKLPAHANLHTELKFVEKLFALLMIFSACSMAFAHGSNDVSNAIGPLAAVVNIINHAGKIVDNSPLPLWILLVGAAGIVLGLTTYGYKVMRTIGQHITELTPSRGFAAELATATTILIASGTGLPCSTTQTLVGGVLGVGFARGIGALNLSVIRNIFMSWIITLPAGAILSIMAFHILKFILPS